MSTSIAASNEATPRRLIRRVKMSNRVPEDLRTVVRIDRRSLIGRDAGRYQTALIKHVGGAPSETQKALIEIAVQLRMRLVAMDIAFAEAGQQSAHDAKQYLAWANSSSRILAKLGLEARKAAPLSLSEYLAGKYAPNAYQGAHQPPAAAGRANGHPQAPSATQGAQVRGKRHADVSPGGFKHSEAQRAAWRASRALRKATREAAAG